MTYPRGGHRLHGKTPKQRAIRYSPNSQDSRNIRFDRAEENERPLRFAYRSVGLGKCNITRHGLDRKSDLERKSGLDAEQQTAPQLEIMSFSTQRYDTSVRFKLPLLMPATVASPASWVLEF